jgi:uncharacterized SAM-binding protein YcdF (DUF218 family)
MFFPVAKLFWLFAEPFNFLLILAVTGAALSFTRRAARFGRGLATFAILLAAIAGLSPLGALLLQPLENRFPLPPADMPAPTGIIVLGGAIDPEVTLARGVPTLLPSGARVLAGAALAERYPNARLVFTGGASDLVGKSLAEAPMAKQLWLSLGIKADRMSFEDKSRNTWENAVFTKALLNPKPGETWLLVTSAWHMPRSVGIFRKVDFKVTPYPVDYRTLPDSRNLFLPRHAPQELTMLADAIHEWVGLVAYHLVGKTDTWFPGPENASPPDSSAMR